MSKKVLIIDIGNTATKFAVFENENLQDFLGFFKFPKDFEFARKVLLSYKNKGFDIDDGMIFSVAPQFNESVKQLVQEIFKKEFTVFDWKGYILENKNPSITEPIGADLLADIIAARTIYGVPCLVADFGTITKLLLVNEKGQFTGLSMIPGIEASLKSFSLKTAFLPDIEELELANNKLGTDTVSSMYHGVYYSTVYYVKDVLKSLQNKKIKLIVTGGNSRYIKNEFSEAIIDNELTLKGMNMLFQEIKE